MKTISPKLVLLTLLLASASISLYLIWGQLTYRSGFPLDDAWIHQTYARNLIDYGEWSYVPGQPSAGSTAPLWTVLLSVGYIWNSDPIVWTNLLGVTCLIVLAILGLFKIGKMPQQSRWYFVLILLVILFEYHLVWAALSGMETILFSLVVCLIILNLHTLSKYPVLSGIILGFTVWIRPDGITLIGPVALLIYIQRKSVHDFLLKMLRIALGISLLIIPYLIFNWHTAGSIWPATYYAKQAEYAVLTDLPFFVRLLSLVKLPFAGVGILLLPGAIIYCFAAFQKHGWEIISGYIWWIGYLLIYVIRLPVTYQHGRYLIPLMPILFFWGILGTGVILDFIRETRLRWIVSRVWILSTVAVLIAFWILGARAYATDVAIIESEMVEAAKWIAQNTPQDSLIAAHDIGALGYYGEREIFDLAGLISPETIQYFYDEPGLYQLISTEAADYLMTFPDWYDQLADCGQIVYATNAPFSPSAGGTNMTVYQLMPDCTIK